MSEERKKSSAWGIGVFALYGLFVVFVLGLVMYASLQDVQLVEESYYEKGLAYQDRIERMQRSRDLVGTLDILHRIGEHRILLSLPAADTNSIISGEVHLLRPSNSRLDRFVDLQLGREKTQSIDTEDLARGLWRVEVNWQMDSAGFYTESEIMIP